MYNLDNENLNLSILEKTLSISNQRTFLTEDNRIKILQNETKKRVLEPKTIGKIEKRQEEKLSEHGETGIMKKHLHKGGFYKKAQRLGDCGSYWGIKTCYGCKSEIIHNRSSCHLPYCDFCAKTDYWRIYERLEPTILKYARTIKEKKSRVFKKYITSELTLTWGDDIESYSEEKQRTLKAQRLSDIHRLLNPYRKKKRILGGVISFEMKRNPEPPFRLHVHAHIFLIAGLLPQKELSSKWKELTGYHRVWISEKVKPNVSKCKENNPADYVLKNLRMKPEILPRDVLLYEKILGDGKRRVSTFGSLYKLSFVFSSDKETTFCPFCNLEMKTSRVLSVTGLREYYMEKRRGYG